MGSDNKETDATYWHPAFYADIQIELAEDAGSLVFESEHHLSANPLQIDVLIIKKQQNRPVKKNIGKIFRKHNIIEYKSPYDYLSIDDFYKVYGYACFYKADVPFVDSIPVQELTITFVSEKYPRKLIRHLQQIRHYTVEKTEPGIYRVKGDFIPIQIIVTARLSKEKNLWLASLTNKLSETESAKQLAADYLKHSDNQLYRAVLETIMQANKKTFEEVNRMGDIFMEIVQEKFDKRLAEAVDKAVSETVDKAVNEAVDKAVNEAVDKAVNEAVTKAVMEEKLMNVIRLIQKKCSRQKPLSVIADELETEPGEITSIYDLIFQNPEKTAEQIYELAAAGQS